MLKTQALHFGGGFQILVLLFPLCVLGTNNTVLWSHQTPVIECCFLVCWSPTWCTIVPRTNGGAVPLVVLLGVPLIVPLVVPFVEPLVVPLVYHIVCLFVPPIVPSLLWVMFTTYRLEIDHLWQDVFEFFLLQNCVMIRKSYQIFLVLLRIPKFNLICWDKKNFLMGMHTKKGSHLD